MGYCEASVHPVGELSWQLYQSVAEAVEAACGVLKALRTTAEPDEAEDINGVLDQLEAAPGPFVSFFNYDGREWAVYVQPLNGEHT